MRLAIGVLLATYLVVPAVGRAEPPLRVHVLAIGHNGLPSSGVDPRLQELRYADDDAAAFARFARDLGGRVIVLSNFDADTAQRFPGLAGQVRAPLRDELRRAVKDLNVSFERDRSTGVEPVVLVTYSGHGVVAEGAPPALVLADGELTQQALYAEVLGALKARYVHLIVDACHAEAIVRPRDAQAETVKLDASEIHSTLARVTLQGLPHVGALIAASASAQAHEWDAWQQGVFTHEVLSGLRGAADVNGDLKVEYSEMAAFLSAANREVRDRAARVRPVLAAPAGTPRAPIVDLGRAKGSAFLVGHAGRVGGLWVEGDDGLRIADLRNEPHHYMRLLVPSGRRLFVRSDRAEAEVTVPAGARVSLDALTLRDRGLHARGALDVSLQRGLFAAAFGPSYYSGFVDRSDELGAVPLSIARTSAPDASVRATVEDRETPVLAWATLGLSGAMLVTSAALGVAALDARNDFEEADGLERTSLAASERFDDYRALSLASLVAGVVAGGISYVLFAQD
jgi:hypothetical protein